MVRRSLQLSADLVEALHLFFDLGDLVFELGHATFTHRGRLLA